MLMKPVSYPEKKGSVRHGDTVVSSPIGSNLFGIVEQFSLWDLPVHCKQIQSGKRVDQPAGKEDIAQQEGGCHQSCQQEECSKSLPGLPASFPIQHNCRLHHHPYHHPCRKFDGERINGQKEEEGIGRIGPFFFYRKIQVGNHNIEDEYRHKIVGGRGNHLIVDAIKIEQGNQPCHIADQKRTTSCNVSEFQTLERQHQAKKPGYGMKGLSFEKRKTIESAERKGCGVIGKSYMQVSQSFDDPEAFNPVDRLRVIQAGIIMRITVRGAVSHHQKHTHKEPGAFGEPDFEEALRTFLLRFFGKKQEKKHTDGSQNQIGLQSYAMKERENLRIERIHRKSCKKVGGAVSHLIYALFFLPTGVREKSSA